MFAGPIAKPEIFKKDYQQRISQGVLQLAQTPIEVKCGIGCVAKIEFSANGKYIALGYKYSEKV